MTIKEKQEKKTRSFGSSIISLACLGVFLYAAYGLLSILYDYYQTDQVASHLQEIYYQDEEDTYAHDHPIEEARGEVTNPVTEKRIRLGFDELKSINEDVVGWMTIEDTKIDYPIMQADNNVDYLDKNFYGDKSLAGSLFMDFRNDITLHENNLIVYGHRVKNGSMFQHLTKYLEEDFFESHRTFTIDTLYDRYEAEIFAVYNTMIDFDYIQTDFYEGEFESLLAGIHQRSIYETDVTVNEEDQIITLSTCEYTLDPDDSRLVIHAKLTKV